ncbi:MAG: TrmH family RNA methyltransferase [Alphaproteobacteria bacterium]
MNESNRDQAPKGGARNAASRNPHKRGKRSFKSEPYWLYGIHAVRAALDNPKRQIERGLFTRNALKTLGDSAYAYCEADASVHPKELDRALPEGAVHQGAALLVHPLDPDPLGSWLKSQGEVPSLIVVLDQVTDPHNVGAVLRSAALFGAGAMICQFRHSPPESGVLAKTACGALERVPMLRETNLSVALETLKDNGYQVVGLAGEAEQTLDDLPNSDRTAIVMGAEGAGLRHKTRETCTALARLDLPEADERLDSLNVSNAAAIALYALTQKAR